MREFSVFNLTRSWQLEAQESFQRVPAATHVRIPAAGLLSKSKCFALLCTAPFAVVDATCHTVEGTGSGILGICGRTKGLAGLRP